MNHQDDLHPTMPAEPSLSHVSAWLDDALEPRLCEPMCQQLDHAPLQTAEAALHMSLIGQVMRGDARSAADVSRTARVLSAVQASYGVVVQHDVQAHVGVPAALQQPASNDAWFNWRAMGSAAAVVLALGAWWQLPSSGVTGGAGQVAVLDAPAVLADAGENANTNININTNTNTNTNTVNTAYGVPNGIEQAASGIGSATPVGSVMIRDPQLDALLAAHRFAGSSNAWPGAVGFVRNVAWTGTGQ
ncbi:MAG: hypothetical protein NWS83_04800 [Burkholderiaceae bacterium]|nr:hypothetical protein [Burkholderiaceae bacterium]